jgi:aspartyl-tRNA(Asn)/glutamyl-tRNA(Gln) amidotransferase subunit A
MSFAETYRERIAKYNSQLSAFVDLADDIATDGLAWAIKSNIGVRGLPHTAGIGAYRDNIATEDAEVVRRIRASNGYVLGTVNMHEGALGATTDNAVFGRTQNPWRAGYTPGGSSGGSGAAVAAGLCDVALGSDTMGSVRIPAAYCGVQGHKPSTGLVSNNGVLALSHTLDHVGPLARNVETLWTAMHILAGWAPAEEIAQTDLSKVRIGIWNGDDAVEMTSVVRDGFDRACRALSDAGANLGAAIEPYGYAYGHSRRAGLLVSEVEAHAIHSDRLKQDPDGFSPGFRKMMEWGARQPASDLQAAYEHISEVRSHADKTFDKVDFVIAPTAPQQAFSFDEPAPANQADFTAWADFAALPATAIYSGCNPQTGLPLSLQIIGASGEDRRTLAVAAACETIFGKPPMPPGFD